MTDDPHDDPHEEGLRDRLSRQGEEALGKIAEELIGNPLVAGALARAFEAREKAVHAQEATMGALGIPSAADVERLTRRLRQVSGRIEGVEDALERLEDRLASIETGVERLAESADSAAQPPADGAVAARLDEIARDLAALRQAVAPGEEPPPRAQERLSVSDG